jgi:hypothetical protein
MTRLRVRNADRGTVLADRARLADSWWGRFRGLLGTDRLAAGDGLILRPCRSIHMFGMRYPIDVAFIDRDGLVVATYAALPPGRWTSVHRTAAAALELPAGTLSDAATSPGDHLDIAPTSENAP